MKFERNLLKFEKDDVIYNDVNTGLTRQNLFDYVAQTGFSSEEVILLHYRNSLSKLRDKQLEKILNEKNTN
jgi:hypothetical protein